MKDSRRKFIKDIGLAASGGLIMSSLPNSAFTAQKRDKLGFALVGLGNYSTGQLGPALKETSNCYLAGIVTGTPEKAVKWSKEYKIPKKNIYNYDNYDEIAQNDDIDVIYVVLPNSMHAEFTIRALKAGKHVICEKPMAMDAAEAEEMINTAKTMKRKLAIGYRMHYDPYFIEAKRIGQEEILGPVNYMETALGYTSTPSAGSWKLKASMGGGSLYNLGVYPIQSARHTKGAEPVFVTDMGATKRNDVFEEFYEDFTWQMEFADGTLCNSYSGASARIDRLFAGCWEGFIRLDPATAYTGQAGESSNGVFDYPQVFQQKLQMEDFARCVMEDQESILSGIDGWRDMVIIDAIHESIKTGKKVAVKADFPE